jgi:hypothetical protein
MWIIIVIREIFIVIFDINNIIYHIINYLFDILNILYENFLKMKKKYENNISILNLL